METTILDTVSYSYADDDEMSKKRVCGGRYSFSDFVSKFNIKVLDNPSPTPGDLVRANRKLVELHCELSREKAIAQMAGRKSEITFINTFIENLDYVRKCIQVMTWGRGIEAKVGTE